MRVVLTVDDMNNERTMMGTLIKELETRNAELSAECDDLRTQLAAAKSELEEYKSMWVIGLIATKNQAKPIGSS